VFREVLVIGLENVPQYGPVIITGNHANQVIDAVTMVCTCQRTISYLVAKKSWNRPIIGHFAWALGAVPVKCSQDLAEVGVGKHSILHKPSDVEQLEGDDNDAANQSHKPSDVEQLEVDYNDTANQSNNHNNPAGISKHETIEIKMKDAKKVTPKHEAIRSSNENSDIKSKDAARDVLEEKTKPVTTSEKCSAEMSKHNSSDIGMDDVKKVVQNHKAKNVSNEKPEIDSTNATRTVSKQMETMLLKEKTEVRKEELKGTLQKHNMAGSPQNCKVSTPKPGGSVSDNLSIIE
jgi:hypothetical protein